MIRFILVCIVVIAYLVLTIPVLLVEWIIGKFSPMTKDISSPTGCAISTVSFSTERISSRV